MIKLKGNLYGTRIEVPVLRTETERLVWCALDAMARRIGIDKRSVIMNMDAKQKKRLIKLQHKDKIKFYIQVKRGNKYL